MLDDATQSTRFGKLTTPLGEDKLLFLRLDATEGLSRPFLYRIEVVVKDKDTEIDPDKLIGENCTFEVEDMSGLDNPTRIFNGMCTDVQWIGVDEAEQGERRYIYELLLRPRFWGLSRRANNRIFEKMTAEDIIKKILEETKVDHMFKLTATLDEIPYCVQYQETNFAFISRLMEKYGLFYYFTHSSSKHEMIIIDSNTNAEACGFQVQYAEVWSQSLGVLNEVAARDSFCPDKVTIQDYDYEAAGKSLEDDYTKSVKHSRGDNEIYRFPGGYKKDDNAKWLAQVILEAERSEAKRATAAGALPALTPGHKFKIEKSPLPKADQEFLLVSAQHTVLSDIYRSSQQLEQAPPISGAFEMVPSDQPYRAPQATPWPRIAGTVSAKVAGQGEIDVDEKGRIMLAFPWERDEHAKYRIRVAQPWAGSKWGSVVIPRVDQEVVVQFEHGNPDRPIVIGAVYNSDNEMPYEMPAEKTKSVYKTDSSEGGGGSNEMRFEDKNGSEEIFVHAQKDMLREVENDDELKVKHDQKITITNDRTETIEMGNDKVTIQKGNRTVKLDLGKSTLDAMTSIELKCGGSSIKLTPSSITIKAPQVTVQGQATLDLKGPLSTLEASAICIVKGAIVKIN